MARPIYYDGSNTLQEMSDSQLERLVYYVQVAYANQLNAGGKGYVYIGSGGTAIGSAVDTKSTEQINSRAAPSNDGVTQTYPGYPGIGTTTVTTYNYQQDRTQPVTIAETYNTSGYLKLAGSNLRVVSADAEMYDEIISVALNELRTGNEVGSYRAATSTPSSGGAGTWTNKGTFFIDTRYNDVGNTTYTLYLKTALSTIPGTNVYPLGIVSSSDGNLIERDIINTSPLVQNVLLPSLTRRLAFTTGIRYNVSTTNTNSRGSFTDTKYNTAINDRYSLYTGLNQVYYSRSTPNTAGTSTSVNTYYFNLL